MSEDTSAYFTPEDESLAMQLVARALERYRKVMPPRAFLEMSELLTDELLFTREGRRKLTLARSAMGVSVDPSGEAVFPGAVAAGDKLKSGT